MRPQNFEHIGNIRKEQARIDFRLKKIVEICEFYRIFDKISKERLILIYIPSYKYYILSNIFAIGKIRIMEFHQPPSTNDSPTHTAPPKDIAGQQMNSAIYHFFTNKKTRSVCLSGYAFRRALISHVEILDSDRGHIFRKYRRKNNKKVTLIYEKTVKNRPLPGHSPPVAMHRIASVSMVQARTWQLARGVRVIYQTQKKNFTCKRQWIVAKLLTHQQGKNGRGYYNHFLTVQHI